MGDGCPGFVLVYMGPDLELADPPPATLADGSWSMFLMWEPGTVEVRVACHEPTEPRTISVSAPVLFEYGRQVLTFPVPPS